MTRHASSAARYHHLATHFSNLIDAVAAELWSNPSPCEGWTALDVVHHVVTTQAEFLGRMPFGPARPLDLEGVTDPDQVAAAWTVVRDHVQSALDDPQTAEHPYDGYFGPTTFAASIETFYASDLAVHAWDVAMATGLVEFQVLDPDEIERHYTEFADLGDTMRQPGIFGAELTPELDADEQTRFLAHLGRHEPIEAARQRRAAQ